MKLSKEKGEFQEEHIYFSSIAIAEAPFSCILKLTDEKKITEAQSKMLHTVFQFDFRKLQYLQLKKSRVID